ncbi:MAG: hypothetical protein JO277_09905 [Candidatus Eremiobacteraeota bacterium]|nr:hypothetical protein [Candidatus Eremiobacteraeota bacterium]
MEIYTISGPDVQLLAPPSAQDTACAQQVKSLVIAGGVARVGAVPVALFGAYKGFKKSGAAAAVSLIASVALWLAGGRLARAAAAGFQKCRGQ